MREQILCVALLCGVFIFCPASLVSFLAQDPTDQHPFDWDHYNCKHFAQDLYMNLTAAGFDAQKLFVWTPGQTGHWMVLTQGYVIEPQTDTIYTSAPALRQHLRELYGGQVPRNVVVGSEGKYKKLSYEDLFKGSENGANKDTYSTYCLYSVDGQWFYALWLGYNVC